MGQNVSIGNLYKETIWVKYEVDKMYVKAEEFEIKAEVEAVGIHIGADLHRKREFDWDKVKRRFTPINSGDYKTKREEKVNCYLTIFTDDGHIVCNTWYVDKDYNWLITKDLGLRRADNKEPLKLHRDEM